MTTMDKTSIQEALVSNFAQLLGCKSQGSGSPNSCTGGGTSCATADDFAECLSEAAGFSDVVCTIPAMEMKVDAKSKDALPGVGDSFDKPVDKPAMAASVLNASETNSEHASILEESAVKTLGSITSWTRSTLVYAPQAVSKNISSSFSSLVVSRVRAWTLLLLRHSLTTGDAASRTRLLCMLSSNIEIQSITTTFKTLPLPDSAKSHVKEADVILPLLFEAHLIVSIQGKMDAVFLRAPGTIAGHFAKGDQPGFMRVDVRLDTTSLLESMVEQARLVVFKAVARATSVNTDTVVKTNGIENNTPNLSTFNSALNLSADAVAQSPQLQKARSSALRLNSVLHGKPIGNVLGSLQASKIRKNRSVQWDNILEFNRTNIEPAGKRPRLVQSQAKLRSFRSFGRPHGGDGGREAKNATFGDFGRTPNGPIWGRDGKMTYHPMAGGGMAASRLSNLALDAQSSQQSNQNATFDLNAPPRRMKRTATALESWLVSNATR